MQINKSYEAGLHTITFSDNFEFVFVHVWGSEIMWMEPFF